jgi:flagellar hook-associated protein 3 FlgL
MRISTRESQLQAVRAMQDNQSRLAKTQLQVATGRAILTPADDPSGAGRVLDLRRAAEAQAQYQRNAEAALNRLSLEETTLGSVTGVLQRVRELALQGANGTLSPQDRAAVATEVRERLDELLGLANTRDGQGEYLFAGSQTRTEPFVRTAGAGGPVYGYRGDDLARAVQVSEGLQVRSGDSGQAVFVAIANGNGTFASSEGVLNAGTGVIDAGSLTDPALWTGHDYRITFVTNGAGRLAYQVRDESSGTQVLPAPPADPVAGAPAFPAGGGTIAFAGVQVAIRGTPAVGDTFDIAPSRDQDLLTTVQHLVDALESAAPGPAGQAHFQNALGRAITDLDRGLDNVLQVRGGVGARLNAVESQKAVAEDFELFARESLSALEDLDYAEAVSRLQLQLTVLQASQQAYVKVQGLSLFNYL